MTMDDDYNEYLLKKHEKTTREDGEPISKSEQEGEATLSWFEDFASKWFPEAAPAPNPVDTSGNIIEPAREFQISGYKYYIHPVQKGRIALFGLSTSGGGYQNLGTLEETNFRMDYVYDAIERHSARREKTK